MVSVPPVILVFDVSALSAATPSEWREFSRVGNCYIPQVVYEEMRMLFDRSPDPDLERLAKAFSRFFATSGWKISDASAHHTALKVGSGQALTRRARVSLAVGRCAYGMAQEFSNSLVILVSKDQSLLQRLLDMPHVNLCGITGEALLQWSRTGQRPIAVSQKFQQFRAAYGLPPSQPSSTPKKPVKAASSAVALSSASSPSSSRVAATKPAKSSPVRVPVFLSEWLPEVKSLILAIAGFAIAGYLIWLLLNITDWGQIFQPPANQQSFLGFFSWKLTS